MRRIKERKVWKSSEYAEANNNIDELSEFVEWAAERGEITSRQASEFNNMLVELADIIDDIGTEGGQKAPQMRRQ